MIFDLKPWPKLEERGYVTVARQQEIITGIQTFITGNPLGWIVLMGRPGVGKTHLMEAIRTATRSGLVAYTTTLTAWMENNRRLTRGEETIPAISAISAAQVYKIASRNRLAQQTIDDGGYNPWKHGAERPEFQTLHVFIDEFDTEPSQTDFTYAHLEELINAFYQHRKFVRLVVTMNKSEQEYMDKYKAHLWRRIFEDDVDTPRLIVDYDQQRGLSSDVAAKMEEQQQQQTSAEKSDAEIQKLFTTYF